MYTNYVNNYNESIKAVNEIKEEKSKICLVFRSNDLDQFSINYQNIRLYHHIWPQNANSFGYQY